jgi:hypothetical protein
MLISTSRPYFAPHAGFFIKALISDLVVLLDAVQFPRKTTWITRNRFKNDQGTLWMTIPVHKKGLGLQRIRQVEICHGGNWARKHLKSILSAYANAPYLADHRKFLEELFSAKIGHLLDFNLRIIGYLADALEIATPMVLMSKLDLDAKGQQLIIDICKKTGADQYLVQPSAAGYYEPERFADNGIALIRKNIPKPIYPQLWGDFIYNLSVFDLLFNCGPKSKDLLAPP